MHIFNIVADKVVNSIEYQEQNLFMVPKVQKVADLKFKISQSGLWVRSREKWNVNLVSGVHMSFMSSI